MGDSWVIPTTIPALPCSRKLLLRTILSTFLGITQEAPMGGSWVIPSVTSLTERIVCHFWSVAKVWMCNLKFNIWMDKFQTTLALPWSFQLLSCSPSTTGLALRFTLVSHNSEDLFKAFIEAFLIIIELSHKILWEEFRIKTNHKVRPDIKGSV